MWQRFRSPSRAERFLFQCIKTFARINTKNRYRLYRTKEFVAVLWFWVPSGLKREDTFSWWCFAVCAPSSPYFPQKKPEKGTWTLDIRIRTVGTGLTVSYWKIRHSFMLVTWFHTKIGKVENLRWSWYFLGRQSDFWQKIDLFWNIGHS